MRNNRAHFESRHLDSTIVMEPGQKTGARGGGDMDPVMVLSNALISFSGVVYLSPTPQVEQIFVTFLLLLLRQRLQ